MLETATKLGVVATTDLHTSTQRIGTSTCRVAHDSSIRGVSEGCVRSPGVQACHVRGNILPRVHYAGIDGAAAVDLKRRVDHRIQEGSISGCVGGTCLACRIPSAVARFHERVR